MHVFIFLMGAGLFLTTFVFAAGEAQKAPAACDPTPKDYEGPFYKPNAPVRASVGQGYRLNGTVRGTKDCFPIEGARIEFWLAGPNGKYDDDHRATLFADKTGTYHFESNFPPTYGGRPSHIHLQVSAKGYKTLVTQHYPAAGQTVAEFDLVLVPEN